jgi:hypothetical protein
MKNVSLPVQTPKFWIYFLLFIVGKLLILSFALSGSHQKKSSQTQVQLERHEAAGFVVVDNGKK